MAAPPPPPPPPAPQTGGNAPPPDMSTKIGSRHVTPALPVVDASPPTPLDQTFHSTLRSYITSNVPLESTEGIQRRERALNRMGTLCREWIKSVCKRQSLPLDVVESAGGQLYTSGSYRLGVHEPGADIDTILVAPSMCTREDFFGSGYIPPDYDGVSDLSGVRDPESLAERIRAHPDVTNFIPVENTPVPLLTFDWEGVNIDLLFARLNGTTVPPSLDIDNDSVLDGVDSATEKSLNGPRVTNLIAALVSGTPDRYETFLTVVRCVRKWAKARGLYSNKMGYWGGVNINIAAALCIQLFPTATPASLLRKFFLVFKSWRWPNPVMLTKPHDAGYGLVVWNAAHVQNARQVAPVITPAYPAMNSTLSVSRQTLQILHEEFCRGHEVVDKLWKKHQRGEALSDDDWTELFEPSDFFISYPYYLSLCIVGPDQTSAQTWAGFVESRLRKLVSDLLGKSLPLSKIQLWPKKFDACVADRAALLTSAQRRNCVTYFVGFQVDTLRMRGRALDVERQLQNFREWELSRFQPLTPGMDIVTKCFKVKELPKIVFEGMYEGGKLEAMKKRRRLRDADPKVQERKRLAKLRVLKAKMERMQKLKELAAAALEEKTKAEEHGEGEGDGGNTTDRKRKRDDDEGDDGSEEDTDKKTDVTEKAEDGGTQEKKEDGSADATEPIAKEESKPEGAVKEEDETDLLENVFDSIQQDAGVEKTREEAEADRRRLLAGELLVEGGGGDDDEEEEHAAEGGRGGDEDGGAGGTGAAYSAEGSATDGGVAKEPPAPKERPLTREEREAEILRRAGYTVVSDDEVVTVGGNMVLPWRRRAATRGWSSSSASVKEEENKNGAEGRSKVGAEAVAKQPTVRIKFRTKFDVVELDADGRVIDKGDDDFQPSGRWTGRRGGFEFKLGERGLGYYRTGKKVVVPSNTAY